MKRRIAFLSTIFLAAVAAWMPVTPVHAQSGGSSFTFLDMATSARVAAMGAEYLSVRDADITLSLANPSLITPELHNHLAFNYVNYFSGINYGFVSYSRTFKKVGSWAFHLQYGNYGKIHVTDEFGFEHGTATANDLAAHVGWGKELDSCFSIGANMKFIFSQMEQYYGLGLAVDVSATYTNRSRLFAVSVLLRNMGGALKSYANDGATLMPFEVAVALSQKIPHTPFRLFLEFPNLQKWDLNYEDPYAEKDLVTGEAKTMSGAAKFFDNLGRHVVAGVELIPYRGFYARVSYNYGRMRDMRQVDKVGLVGISWGVGIRIAQFNISYARSRYHMLGAPNYISLTLDLDAFKGKRTKAHAAVRKAEGDGAAVLAP